MNDTLWTLVLTLGVYTACFWLQKKTKKSILNPLLMSSIVIMIFLLLTRIPYETYKQGTKFITFLIGPATVSLAIPLYEQLPVLKKHWKVILGAILSGVLVHAIVIGLIVFAFQSSLEMMATVLPKSVTTPIAVEITKSLGGLENLTAGIVIVTGIFGAVISPYIFKLLHIKNPIAIGLALGSSSHAVGTSRAAELGEVETSMATISLVLTGVLTVVSAPLVYFILSLILPH